MFGYPPYGNWGGPATPVVFYPPRENSSQPSLEQMIAGHLSTADLLKKLLKEEKKEEKKDDKKKDDKDFDPKLLNMMFLMVLLSPITGALMYKLFQWGAGSLPIH